MNDDVEYELPEEHDRFIEREVEAEDLHDSWRRSLLWLVSVAAVTYLAAYQFDSDWWMKYSSFCMALSGTTNIGSYLGLRLRLRRINREHDEWHEQHDEEEE